MLKYDCNSYMVFLLFLVCEGEGKTTVIASLEIPSETGGEIKLPSQNISLSNENYIWLLHICEIQKKPFSTVVNDYITSQRLSASLQEGLKRSAPEPQQKHKHK